MNLSMDDIQGVTKDIENPNFVEREYPPVVKGRVAHIDADFLAYMASYEKKGEDNSLEGILYRTDVMIEDKRREAGAETSVLHLTPKLSDKGGRYDAAIQKKYQGQRSSDRKPEHLEAARAYMAEKTGRDTGRSWLNAEADDGMAEAAWKAYDAGNSESVIIVTKDKDLKMCPGLHLVWDTGEIVRCEGTFGWTGLQVTEKVDTKTGKIKKTKKFKGYGTKFFWLQMLMGDTADNIKGVPKAFDAAGKHKACGQVFAVELLEKATSDRECLRIVIDAYKSNEYVHWETGEPVGWQDVFKSEAKLLWMQRTAGDLDDVLKWIKEIK